VQPNPSGDIASAKIVRISELFRWFGSFADAIEGTFPRPFKAVHRRLEKLQ
jgi:hypothetical protein